MNAPFAAPSPLLFSWELPHRQRVTIAAFLAASLIAHALCFYIFQIVYPPTVALLPPPARISLIAPSSEEGRTLLRWVEAEDPALAFSTQRPPEAKVRVSPKMDHVPSYLVAQPALKEVPPLLVDLRMPTSQPPAAVPIPRRQTSPAATVTPTTVSFSKELDSFGIPNFSKPSFTASNNEPDQSIRFRVAVNARGEIHYCFPLNSSGDPALDVQARHYVILCRFSEGASTAEAVTATGSTIGDKADQSLVWGIATVEWGNDVATPSAASTTPSAP